MLFSSQNTVSRAGTFRIPAQAKARANAVLCTDVFAEFWQGFTHNGSTLSVTPEEELVFVLGEAEIPALSGNAYAISVTEKGIAVAGANEQGLVHGFLTLLDRIRMTDGEEGGTQIDAFALRETPKMKNRMVHFCIFPETELWELERFIRFAGALRFSHIVLEFWGMLRYDVMGELAWAHAYSKEEIRPLIALARSLGLSVIPMFNHWGHATASRVVHGKHVVLDQNPALASYFSEDGWCWDIRRQKVRALLRAVRRELCELCGEGEYFHIGCDEAYSFDGTRESMDTVTDFINEVTAEMRAEGRRVIMWGDMLLFREAHFNPQNRYACLARSSEAAKYLRDRLDHGVVIADWQYDAVNAPLDTAKVFRDEGFDTLICPWDRSHENVRACLDTAEEYALFGVLHTTWHTLSTGMPVMALAAVGAYDGSDVPRQLLRPAAAAFLRKVSFANGVYRKAGFSKTQVGDVIP
jgi:hypothetical protein